LDATRCKQDVFRLSHSAKQRKISHYWESEEDELVSRIDGGAQTKLPRVFGTKKKVQVGIQAGIPFLPAVPPVGSGEIANIIAEDFYGLGAISLGLCIKNEFRLAGRRESGVPGGRRSRLGTLIH